MKEKKEKGGKAMNAREQEKNKGDGAIRDNTSQESSREQETKVHREMQRRAIKESEKISTSDTR